MSLGIGWRQRRGAIEACQCFLRTSKSAQRDATIAERLSVGWIKFDSAIKAGQRLRLSTLVQECIASGKLCLRVVRHRDNGPIEALNGLRRTPQRRQDDAAIGQRIA